MPSLLAALTFATLAALTSAKTIKITATSDNTFDPNSLEADKNDVLEFHFEAKNHSVVAGDYQYPCSPLDLGSGFFSGFIPTASGTADKVFQVTINDTEPLVFYSSQDDECAQGMVGIVNPSQNKTLSDYEDHASELSQGVTPGRTSYGGKLVDSSDAGSDKNSKDSTDKDHQNNAISIEASIGGTVVRVVASVILATAGVGAFWY
ncbi:hypothetical protein B0T10DRAFT_557574 [Thelonectria olida]|uniref:Extracellular serine-rich protein n=1 Tax=Thelonectria olida TaxID=1576542 RepID=A0A9P8WCH7_9HYPO|nr:hypothetical protein B0T10DRAFT_557574 [Thelonectria olida]